MGTNADIYERFNLYSGPDKFYIEPRDKTGLVASDNYLEIDKNDSEIVLRKAAEAAIPVHQTEVTPIFGLVGVIPLVSGNHLIVVKNAAVIGAINGADVYRITETEVIPYSKAELHLTERQQWFNRHFREMLQLVLTTTGFYFSPSFDLSHTVQWLRDNATPHFRQLQMLERANPRFVWNRHLAAPFSAIAGAGKFATPIIHGFVGIRNCIVRGSHFKLVIISRRSIHRAGTRFYMRGTDSAGNSANYVETEQIVEFDYNRDPTQRILTSFVQTRGSIPLYWTQKPNLRWQPCPTMKPTDDQLEAYVRHMNLQHQIYGGRHVIVNLVNQKGRERSIGGELERVAIQANLDFVRYVGFDFHHECKGLGWEAGLNQLRDLLLRDILSFGYAISDLSGRLTASQLGYFRTNCMDCLDRTNVVQALIAKESLLNQLVQLGIVDSSLRSVDDVADFSFIFKNLWADNGDECSKQYAGTGALKTDFTRIGKRTVNGAINDGVNAITRYFKNNFADGYRQDAIDLFLGNVRIDPANLPTGLEDSVLNVNANGGAIVGAVFSAAMMLLCVLVSENTTATLFWFAVFFAFTAFIFFHGEEFVNRPKLKQD